MGKGRQFAPSQEEHGIWFQHRGMPSNIENRVTGTTTGKMLDKSNQGDAHEFCPPIFAEKMSLPHSDNAFSCHDNRNAFQDHGVYFGQNLGKLKIAHEQGQHHSQDIVTWDKSEGGKLPPSVYTGNYSEAPPPVNIKTRRYPKTYGEPASGPVKLDTDATTWCSNDETVPPTYLQTLANTQEPHPKHNTWKYSYHAKSFSVSHQPKKVS